jgi:hypothetical protein
MPPMLLYVFRLLLMMLLLKGSKREGSRHCHIPQGLCIVLGDGNWYCLFLLVCTLFLMIR